MEIMEMLKELPIFKGLTQEERQVLKDIISEKKYEKGMTIFEEGAPGGELFIINQGKVEVRLKRGDLVLVLAELEEKSFFGELSLVGESERSATCVAMSDTTLFSIRNDKFWEIAEKYPRIGLCVLKNLSEEISDRIRETNRNLETYFLINQAIIDNEQFRKLYITARKRV